MIDEEKSIEMSIELRRRLFTEFREFWLNYPKEPTNVIFYVNSASLGSLLAHATHLMFKKNLDNETLCKYIDDVCYAAKIQLCEAKELLNNGVN